MEYREYINSPEWHKKRSSILKRDAHRCRVCNRGAERVLLNVHHRTYENLGDERDSDLITLCEECHTLFHAHTGSVEMFRLGAFRRAIKHTGKKSGEVKKLRRRLGVMGQKLGEARREIERLSAKLAKPRPNGHPPRKERDPRIRERALLKRLEKVRASLDGVVDSAHLEREYREVTR